MNITIIDNIGAKTAIGVGIFPQGVRRPLRNSVEITGWIERISVTLPSRAVITVPPFNIFEGAVLYNTGTLFLFSGSRDKARDKEKTVLILWSFKFTPKTGDKGSGRLNSPPAAGALSGGDITWNIE